MIKNLATKKILIMALFALIIFTLAFAQSPTTAFADEVTASTIYVSNTGDDSNAGTENAPYLTLQTAVDNATAGDTIYIMNDIEITTSVSVWKSLNFVGAGEGVKISLETGSSLNSVNGLFNVGRNADRYGYSNLEVVFDNLEFEFSSQGIYVFAENQSITVNNCTISNGTLITMNGACNENSVNGLTNYSDYTDDSTGVSNLTLTNNTITVAAGVKSVVYKTEGGGNFIATGNTMTGTSTARGFTVEIDPAASETTTSSIVTITNNTFTTFKKIVSNDSSDAIPASYTISNNIFIDCIYGFEVEALKVTNCGYDLSYNYFEYDDVVSSVKILNSAGTVSGNSQYDEGLYDGESNPNNITVAPFYTEYDESTGALSGLTSSGVATYFGVNYLTLQDAIDYIASVTGLSKSTEYVIELMEGTIVEEVTITQEAYKNITIKAADGADVTMQGSIAINGDSRNEEDESVTISGIDFVSGNVSSSYSFVSLTKNTGAHNITVDSCTFTDTQTTPSQNVVAVRANSSSSYYHTNITISNCEMKSGHSFFQGYNVDGLSILNCNIEIADGRGVNISNASDVLIANTNIDVDSYAVRTGGTINGTFEIKNSTLYSDNRWETDGYYVGVITLRHTAGTAEITLTNNVIQGDEGIAIYAVSIEDSSQNAINYTINAAYNYWGTATPYFTGGTRQDYTANATAPELTNKKLIDVSDGSTLTVYPYYSDVAMTSLITSAEAESSTTVDSYAEELAADIAYVFDVNNSASEEDQAAAVETATALLSAMDNADIVDSDELFALVEAVEDTIAEKASDTSSVTPLEDESIDETYIVSDTVPKIVSGLAITADASDANTMGISATQTAADVETETIVFTIEATVDGSEVANSDLIAPVTFKMYLPEAFYDFDYVLVIHESDDESYGVEEYKLEVQTDDEGVSYYVEMTVAHFSTFTFSEYVATSSSSSSASKLSAEAITKISGTSTEVETEEVETETEVETPSATVTPSATETPTATQAPAVDTDPSSNGGYAVWIILGILALGVIGFVIYKKSKK